MTTSSTSRGTWTPGRLLDDLERLALRAPTRAVFFDEAAARLKRAVPFDGACWHTLDPGSDLITQHRLQDLPDRFPVLASIADPAARRTLIAFRQPATGSEAVYRFDIVLQGRGETAFFDV